MGVACADIDNDGDLDMLVTHLAGETKTLYANEGGSWFEDRTSAMAVAGGTIPFTGFGTSFLDYDHDGNLDLLIANGRVKRGPALPNVPLRTERDIYAEPNTLFQGMGTYRFRAMSDRAGRLCSVAEVSRGLAVGDIDNDGDLDVLITNGAGPRFSRPTPSLFMHIWGWGSCACANCKRSSQRAVPALCSTR